MEAVGLGGGNVANAILLQLSATQHARTVVSNRLATGLRITTAADDPSGYVIATNLQTRVSSLDAASASTQNAVNYLHVATGALQSAIALAQRIRTLAVAADNSTLSTNDRKHLQTEVTQLVAQINAISANTSFNGSRIFSEQNTPLTPPTIGAKGFEVPVLAAHAFQYGPSGTAWTYASGGGVSGNGSAFTSSDANAPEGTQVAFLQNGGTIKQTLSGFVSQAAYTFSFYAAARSNGGGGGNQDFSVSLDGTVIGTYHVPIDHNYHTLTTAAIEAGPGSHTLLFRGLDTAGGDNTDFIDNVQVTVQDLRPTSTLVVHGGAAEGDSQTTQMQPIDADELGLSGIDLTQGYPGGPIDGADLAIGLADTALTTLTTFAAKLGARSQALSDKLTNNNITAVNTQSAESTIRDLNVANAVTENVRLQLLTSLQTATLAKTNTQANDILALFR